MVRFIGYYSQAWLSGFKHSYNSVIFATLSANDYAVVIANESFLDPLFRLPDVHDSTSNYVSGSQYYYDSEKIDLMRDIRQKALKKDLDQLENEECIRAYAQNFLSTRSNVVMISKDFENRFGSRVLSVGVYINDNSDIDNPADEIGPFSWLCSTVSPELNFCNSAEVIETASRTGGWHFDRDFRKSSISYCLSQKTEDICKLMFSPAIAIITVLFNVTKLVIIFLLFHGSSHKPLMIIGDGLTSYLKRSDPTTARYALFSSSDFNHFWTMRTVRHQNARHRWHKSVGSARLVFYITM